MVVCHCRVVTDRAIRQAIGDGAQDLDTVGDLCGAGDECGGCLPSIEQLLADAAVAIQAPEMLARRQASRRWERAHPHPVAV